MADGYEKNGYAGDFKRNPEGGGEAGEGAGPPGALSESAGAYLRSLLAEKIKLSQGSLPLTAKLLDLEVDRVQTQGRLRPPDRFVDIYREKPVKVVAKVLVPTKDFPKFNFVGKLLGPKGNTMKQLQEETMCKMAILGRGSMRDRQKEEEFRNSLDPKYAHLSDELHVEISALGPPAEAHARIAYALAEVRKHLMPDGNDMIRQGQMQMMERGPPMRGPPMRPPHPPPQQHRPVVPAKTKVLSILDRARAAMDEYPYEDPYARQEPPVSSTWVRGGPRAPPAGDYYGYERAPERHYGGGYEEEEGGYYKPPAREYKPTQVRDVGARRGAGQNARYHTREAPYARPGK